ncbi:uncharacterized protein LOC143897547 isoform X3 [Temnothorax americanus]|uniref:uncharacterized protein LOC143897547 isoform X3 n=1 Tax=Temnothorax americanus TaxID=1964332 RepID=UPI004068C3B3
MRRTANGERRAASAQWSSRCEITFSPGILRCNSFCCDRRRGFLSSISQERRRRRRYMQRQNVTYFVQEFGCEPKDTSGRCVNVGSGTGETTRKVLLPVLNRDAVTIGTDVSESMVEYANRIHGVDGVLEFETLDIFRRETCPRSTSPSSTTRSHSPFCISATTSDAGLKK